MKEEAKLFIERDELIRKETVELSKKENLSYEDAYAVVSNKYGNDSRKDLGKNKNFGQESYYCKQAKAIFGPEIDGTLVETIPPETLAEIITAYNMGSEIKYTKGMNVKKEAINNKIQKEKTKKKDKVLELQKPKKNKDVNAA